mmetsp:Transcript_31574/g.80533  ORF Transcript_31574/g.80533 Transcript_31574/m.80533 type:complete len:268 (-) Transcript_31574:835-1638(-)
MGPDYELQVVHPAELIRDIRAEHEDAAALAVGGSVASTAAGVRPQEVNHEAHVLLPLLLRARRLIHSILVGVGRELSVTVHCADLRDRGALRVDRHGVLRVVRLAWEPYTWAWARNASVDHKNLIVHEVQQGQVAEGLREEVEQVHVVLAPRLARKAVDHVGLEHLVVAAVQVHSARLFQLHGEDRHDHFDGPGAAVNEVAIEEEWRILRGQASHRQDVEEVEVLPVQVTVDSEALAWLDVNVVQGALTAELHNHIQDNEVRVLLWQ